MLGELQFRQLQTKQVTVVGLGAVGGYVVEGLVRAGVSRLHIVDFDTIQASNLNRQILALTGNIGRSKVEVARERILAINQNCRVQAENFFAGEETLERIFSPRPDLLIDAIDSLNPKVQLLHGAYIRDIPTISSMGAALRTDPALIRCADIFDTRNCPLARHLRKRLRRRGVERGISCVYSTEKNSRGRHQQPQKQSVDINPSPHHNRGRKRNILGSLPTITGIFGLIIANQAIMRLSQAPVPKR